MLDTVAYIVGWTLVHSLWQGALVAVLAAVLLAVVPRGSARIRYGILCGALFANLAAPAITAMVLAPGAATAARSQRLTSPTSPLSLASLKTLISRPSAVVVGDVGPASGITGDATGASRSDDLPTRVSTTLSAHNLERFLPLLAVVWTLGVLVSAARRIGGWFWLRRIVSRATPAGRPLAGRVARLARAMGIRRGVNVRVSGDVTGPFTSGWLRPVIVMPLTMLSGLDPVHVDAILTHGSRTFAGGTTSWPSSSPSRSRCCFITR